MKTFILAAAVALAIGCEGPTGPAGPQGETGSQGPQGNVQSFTIITFDVIRAMYDDNGVISLEDPRIQPETFVALYVFAGGAYIDFGGAAQIWSDDIALLAFFAGPGAVVIVDINERFLGETLAVAVLP